MPGWEPGSHLVFIVIIFVLSSDRREAEHQTAAVQVVYFGTYHQVIIAAIVSIAGGSGRCGGEGGG